MGNDSSKSKTTINNNNNKSDQVEDQDFGLLLKSIKPIDKNRFVSTIRCTILGGNGSGKTSFMRRFSTGEFNIEETTTNGAIRTLHTIHFNNISLNLEIWDTGGHDRLNGFLPIYMKGSNCIIVMYDVTSRESFAKAFDLLSKTKNMVPAGSIYIMVANKVDLVKSREISLEEMSKSCSESDLGKISWCEISARTGYNIHEPFHIISQYLTTMLSALRVNQRIEKIHNTTLLSKSGSSIIGGGSSGTTLSVSSSNVGGVGENNLSLSNNGIERSFKQTPLINGGISVLLKLEILKIILEPTSSNMFNKLLSRRTFIFKELNESTGGSGGSSDSNNDFQNSGEFKGSFCLVIDKFHPKRIEFKKRVSNNNNNSNDKNELVLLCDYRDHLVKSFISLCPVTIPRIEGTKGGDRSDFLFCVKECLKSMGRELDTSIEFQIENPRDAPFLKLELSRILTDEKYIIALSNAIIWNGTIASIDLSYNSYGTIDIKVLSELLTAINNSVSIVHLDLAGNKLNSKHKSVLMGKTLTSLGLSNNKLNNDNAQTLAQMLQINSTLEVLDLSSNIIDEDGALYLLNSLEKSNGINSNLNSSTNNIKPTNSTLYKLYMGGNKNISAKTLNQIKSIKQG
eukprot:gene6134-7642_t